MTNFAIVFCAILWAISPSNSEFNVLVTCHQEHIDVAVRRSSVESDASGTSSLIFSGIVHSRPDRRCSVIGWGKQDTHLVIPLDIDGRKQCGVVEYNNSFVAVIDVRQHAQVEMVTDETYLVSCPIDATKPFLQRKDEVNVAAHVNVLMENDEVESVRVGQVYTMMVKVPLKREQSAHRIGQCIAFTGVNDVQLLQLTDSDGCPTAHEVLHEFEEIGTDDVSTRLQTKMEMFRFNGSDHFFLQCQLIECETTVNGSCAKTECMRPVKDMRGLSETKQLQTTLIGKRINIERNVQIVKKQFDPTPCDIESQQRNRAYLSILMAILIMLSTIVWIAAWFNRPFRIALQIAPGDQPYSIKENLFKVVDEAVTPESERRLIFDAQTFRKKIANALSTIAGRRCRVTRPALHAFDSSLSKRDDFLNVDDILAKPRENLSRENDKSSPGYCPQPHPRRITRQNDGQPPPLPPKSTRYRPKPGPRSIDWNGQSSSLSDLDRLPGPPSVTVEELRQLNAQMDASRHEMGENRFEMNEYVPGRSTRRFQEKKYPVKAEMASKNPHFDRSTKTVGANSMYHSFPRRRSRANSENGQIQILNSSPFVEPAEERIFGGTIKTVDRDAHREFVRFAAMSRTSELRHTVGGKFLNWKSNPACMRRAFDDGDAAMYENFRRLNLAQNSSKPQLQATGKWNLAAAEDGDEAVQQIEIVDELFLGERPRSCASTFFATINRQRFHDEIVEISHV